MCKLVVANKKEGENKPLREFLRAQLPLMNAEKDGAGCLIVGKDGKARVMRSFAYEEVYKFLGNNLDDAVLFGLHTRTATAGSISEDNIHFFGKDGRYMAHNGIVEGYAPMGFAPTASRQTPLHSWKNCQGCLTAKRGYCRRHERDLVDWYDGYRPPQSGKSDTLQFLEGLPPELSEQTLAEYAASKRFWGFGFLYDENTATPYLLIKKPVKVVRGHGFSCFLSFPPAPIATKRSASVCGVQCEREQITPLKVLDACEGIYRLYGDVAN